MELSVFKTPGYLSQTPTDTLCLFVQLPPACSWGYSRFPRPLSLLLQRDSGLAALETLAWSIYFLLNDLGQALHPPTPTFWL